MPYELKRHLETKNVAGSYTHFIQNFIESNLLTEKIGQGRIWMLYNYSLLSLDLIVYRFYRLRKCTKGTVVRSKTLCIDTIDS